jgi:hypothetical protein
LDILWFGDAKQDRVTAFLTTPEAKTYRGALDAAIALSDGLQSPLGMERPATVDWLLYRNPAKPDPDHIRTALRTWPGGDGSGERKLRLFDDRLIAVALERLAPAWNETASPRALSDQWLKAQRRDAPGQRDRRRRKITRIAPGGDPNNRDDARSASPAAQPGRSGGAARATALSPEKLAEIAKQAAAKRRGK